MRLNVTPWTCACLALMIAQARGASSLDGFYLGTLTRGNRTLEVGVTLETAKNRVTGSYFYFGTAAGWIGLEGTRGAGQAIRLNETARGGQVTGRWHGKLVGDGIEGVWTNTSNGRQWTFRLRRAEQAATFEGPATTLDSGDGPIAFRTARVPASRHRVPLITEFHDPRVLNEVNTLLMFVANDSRCPAGVPDDYALEAKVSFAGAGLLSLRIVQSRMCQGARAAVVDRSRVYRLPDAVLLGFGNLFQHYRIPDDRLFAALFPYERSRVQAGSGLVAAGEDDRACHAVWTPKSFAEDGREPDFHLTAEGVVVRLQVPDGLAACANEVTVPYSAVGPVVWPSGGLARLAEANAGKPMRYRIHRPGTDPKDDILFTPSGK